MNISVIVPVFGQGEVLASLHARIDTALSKVDGTHEIIFIDDNGSRSSA